MQLRVGVPLHAPQRPPGAAGATPPTDGARLPRAAPRSFPPPRETRRWLARCRTVDCLDGGRYRLIPRSQEQFLGILPRKSLLRSANRIGTWVRSGPRGMVPSRGFDAARRNAAISDSPIVVPASMDPGLGSVTSSTMVKYVGSSTPRSQRRRSRGMTSQMDSFGGAVSGFIADIVHVFPVLVDVGGCDRQLSKGCPRVTLGVEGQGCNFLKGA